MKVLVTGASGFIGNYVVKELLNKGHQVVATATSKEKLRLKEWSGQVSIVEHTIGKEKPGENLFEKFTQPQLLIHLAWKGLPNYRDLFHFEDNLPRQYNFIKKLRNDGLEDMTITGTCFEYGMREGCLSEEMIPNPENAYAIAKNSLRLFLEQLQKLHPFHLKWVRLFYMYGKGQHPGSLFPQLEKALQNKEAAFNMSGGEQLRDYMPVEEMAANIVSIAMQNHIQGIINCSSNQPVKLKDLVTQYIARSGS
ncbi:MAG TPA: NAD(P)-dependent oxidoreductase, partial [Chitinophagaceae bacterium]|nr:NAD(P)-dependent oxidoreductase [Chitinophagaceae bacterium]